MVFSRPECCCCDSKGRKDWFYFIFQPRWGLTTQSSGPSGGGAGQKLRPTKPERPNRARIPRPTVIHRASSAPRNDHRRPIFTHDRCSRRFAHEHQCEKTAQLRPTSHPSTCEASNSSKLRGGGVVNSRFPSSCKHLMPPIWRQSRHQIEAGLYCRRPATTQTA